jgi:hypothetical protein
MTNYTFDGRWVSDSNGNRASVVYWGSREKAEASLATLKDCSKCQDCQNCRDCQDCHYCHYCRGCRDCHYCQNCQDCQDCRYCQNCQDCRDCHYCQDCQNCRDCRDCRDCHYCQNCSRVRNAQSPVVVGPSRSDGYQFVMGASRSIHAGCRVFVSLAEARTHFETTRGGTPLGAESLLILDQIEALAALRTTGGAL